MKFLPVTTAAALARRGKILRVDLTTGSMRDNNLPEEPQLKKFTMRGCRSLFLAGLLCLPLLSSCAPRSFSIATIRDDRLERFVAEEALKIIRVSENTHKAALYQVHLVNFPRKDILGLSIGNHQIFVSYELSRLAYENERYRWLFRQTLAHEIAHDVLGRGTAHREAVFDSVSGLARRVTTDDLGLAGNIWFRHYSRFSELEADKKGIEYWLKIGWDCRNWVSIFKGFLKQGYNGDVDHPTKERLIQAMAVCPESAKER